jgi:hypothetical protein
MPTYEVWSTYKVTGTAYVEAGSAKEAVEMATAGDGKVQFDFSEPHGETKMRARRVRATKPTENEETQP